MASTSPKSCNPALNAAIRTQIGVFLALDITGPFSKKDLVGCLRIVDDDQATINAVSDNEIAQELDEILKPTYVTVGYKTVWGYTEAALTAATT